MANGPSAPERLAGLLLAAVFEPDPVRGRQLAEQYATEFNRVCEAAWDRRLAAKRALLDEAEVALDAAETAVGPAERRRHLRLFELLMASVEVDATSL
jgi:hypothetical protein